MPNLTTDNLQKELQNMFDTSGGIFYKEDSKEPILIVEPSSPTKTLSNEILINGIAASLLFLIVLLASDKLIELLFIKSAIDAQLKRGPKYNIAPTFIVYTIFTVMVSTILIISASKYNKTLFVWAIWYIVVQLYLLIKTTLIFPVEFDYKFVGYYLLSVIGLKKGNYIKFIVKTILTAGFIAILATLGNIPMILFTFLAIIMGMIFPWLSNIQT